MIGEALPMQPPERGPDSTLSTRLKAEAIPKPVQEAPGVGSSGSVSKPYLDHECNVNFHLISSSNNSYMFCYSKIACGYFYWKESNP